MSVNVESGTDEFLLIVTAAHFV